MLTHPCTDRVLLCGFTNTHTLTYTPTCRFLHQNNCMPPMAVKPCQCLVSFCIDSSLASTIRKGQGGVVCTVTQCADCTHPAGSDPSVWATLKNFFFFLSPHKNHTGLIFSFNMSGIIILRENTISNRVNMGKLVFGQV